MASAPRRVKGEWEMGGQYHFTMEPHTVRVIPTEDGQLNIHSATQGIKHVVDAVSDVVNVPANKSVQQRISHTIFLGFRYTVIMFHHLGTRCFKMFVQCLVPQTPLSSLTILIVQK